MTIEQIYRFFQHPPLKWLTVEMAVAYVLSVLLEKESYGLEMLQIIGDKYPGYSVSDTVLYGAFRFLERKGVIKSYLMNAPGRGRPRKIYRVTSEGREQAQRIAYLWQEFIERTRVRLSIDK